MRGLKLRQRGTEKQPQWSSQQQCDQNKHQRATKASSIQVRAATNFYGIAFMTQKSSAFSKVSLTRVTLLSSFLLGSFKVLFASLSLCLSISAFVYLLENLPPYACTAWDKISVITNLHVNFCKLSPWGLVLQASWTQCLKITEKVASNIASEASYLFLF